MHGNALGWRYRNKVEKRTAIFCTDLLKAAKSFRGLVLLIRMIAAHRHTVYADILLKK
jgi:hypothetical protein